ncbi:hypothetical protein B0I35DRAFT_170150 [Stachybotrys elegans]|uniref:Zn(2)-C6 fungal-type domain-containing protein n=1 Tax=Stachybotrys elegans TaxID=80388 RepID=A0A8K0WUK0_9HYPO|nr:hypothetical protein B0I35DRAFT_170150 [Stachybotrys elegans]
MTNPGSNLIVFSLDNRKRQTRICTTRSRTGCRQCKQRRTKCDETKPSCSKCVAKGLVCDGMWVAKTAASPPSSICVSPRYETHIFPDQRSWDFFQLFIIASAPGGTLPAVAMVQLVPQIALQQPALRALCCAIGASAASFQFLNGGRLDERLHRESLQYHSEAVSLCRAFKGTTAQMLRLALMSAYLFMGFEIASNNVDSAFTHFRFAHYMMQQYVNVRCKEANLTPAELKFDYVESAIFCMLQRFTIHRWPGLPDNEQELDPSLKACCQGQRSEFLVDDAPESFHDVDESSKWWDITLHFLKHHLRPRRLEAIAQGDYHVVSALVTKAIETLRNWHTRFLPLAQKAQQTKQSDPWFHIQVLTMEALYSEAEYVAHALASHTKIGVPTSPKRWHLEMIKATRALLKPMRMRGKETLSDEYAALRPLGFVVYKSRDLEVLREVEKTLEMVQGNAEFAMALRTLIKIRDLEGWEQNQQLVATVRSWAWFFTSTGCAGLTDM